MIGEVARRSDVGIDADVTGRPKHLYSIYRKMVRPASRSRRSTTSSASGSSSRGADCYAALGLIHTMWPPVQGASRTTSPCRSSTSTSRCTRRSSDRRQAARGADPHAEMHERAEHGIAAHWRYKEGDRRDELPSWPICDSCRRRRRSDRVPREPQARPVSGRGVRADPEGDVITLPAGDAGRLRVPIHTDVGHRCVGAKVNGRLVPLRPSSNRATSSRSAPPRPRTRIRRGTGSSS